MNWSLVRLAASRFPGRGNGETDDIVQVGVSGLVKATDRFDPSREVEFTTYAIPYLVGEIKRYFRDHTWPCTFPAGSRNCGSNSPGPTETPARNWSAGPPYDGKINKAGRTYADTLGAYDPAMHLVEDFHTRKGMLDQNRPPSARPGEDAPVRLGSAGRRRRTRIGPSTSGEREPGSRSRRLAPARDRAYELRQAVMIC